MDYDFIHSEKNERTFIEWCQIEKFLYKLKAVSPHVKNDEKLKREFIE